MDRKRYTSNSSTNLTEFNRSTRFPQNNIFADKAVKMKER